MSTVCYCGQSTCPVTESANPGACINAAQAAVTALRARVAERDMALKRAVRQQYGDRMKDERDEWKAKVTEAAALAERLREALTKYGGHLSPCFSAVGCDCGFSAALSTPAPAWLRERDRALAMRVAEAVRDADFSDCLCGAVDSPHKPACDKWLAAIAADEAER